MIDAVLALSKEYDMFPAGGMILCAVSGGADSMCLLHLLCSLAPSAGFTVAAAHYNHGLRGGESDADEAFVTGFCRQNRIPFFLGKGKVAEAAAASAWDLKRPPAPFATDFWNKRQGTGRSPKLQPPIRRR
jgi:tRNA(Ile)-lysidine synthase